MSFYEDTSLATPVAKKRKRTGKDREIAKANAIAAKELALTKASQPIASVVPVIEVQAETEAGPSTLHFQSQPEPTTEESKLPGFAQGKKRKRALEKERKLKELEERALQDDEVWAPMPEYGGYDEEQEGEGLDAEAEGEFGGEGGYGAGLEEGPKELDLEVLKKRIPQALKSLLTILKKSKISEQQRLIKKVKFLRSKTSTSSEPTPELKDLESQLEGMKKLDLHLLPPGLLEMKLKKHPRVKTLEGGLPADILPLLQSSTKATPTPTALETKLSNRLYSAKGVGEAVNSVVGWCVQEQGKKLLTQIQTQQQTAKAKKEASAAVQQAKSQAQAQGQVQGQSSQLRASASSLSAESKGGDVDMEDGGDDEDWAREDEAADAAGWESGSLDGEGGGGGGGGGMELGSGSDDEDSEEDDDEEESDSDEPPPKKQSKSIPSKTIKPLPLKSIKSSLFLPSLSAGYTMGDAGEFSDPEEEDRRYEKGTTNGKANGTASTRTNRRGQRERRAIWEKKYGGGANHKKKEAEELKKDDQSRKFLEAQSGKFVGKNQAVGDQGWGKRQPTSSSSIPGTKASYSSSPYSKSAAAPSAPPAAPPSKTALGKEHGSWQAAQLRKQREQEAMATIKPKKVVFD